MLDLRRRTTLFARHASDESASQLLEDRANHFRDRLRPRQQLSLGGRSIALADQEETIETLFDTALAATRPVRYSRSSGLADLIMDSDHGEDLGSRRTRDRKTHRPHHAVEAE